MPPDGPRLRGPMVAFPCTYAAIPASLGSQQRAVRRMYSLNVVIVRVD